MRPNTRNSPWWGDRTKRSLAGALGGALLMAVLLSRVLHVAAQDPPAVSAPPAADVEALIADLGHEDYQVRERNTQELLKLGPDVAAQLLERLARESDAEIRHRLRFVLECVIPPDHAVLVLNAAPGCGLEPGELITHVGAWRIRHATELRNLLAETANAPLSLRVAGAAGPRDLVRFDRTRLYSYCDYVAPAGARIAAALTSYRDGLAEQAAEILDALGPNVPEEALPTLVRARIDAVAGRMPEALRLLAATPEVVRPAEHENRWLGASKLDRVLPGKAPFYLEWTLWNLVREGVEDDGDPDLRTQRILVPANRFLDALHSAAGYWTSRFRDAPPGDEKQSRNGGNMLAVSSWMLAELSLLSECQRLVEPRSVILRASANSPRKWMRVQTDAWLPYFAGDLPAAIATLYRDAVEVLQDPDRFGLQQQLIRNPAIAAEIAFFLYQAPQDPRIHEMLETVNRQDNADLGLPAYASWMLLGLNPANADLIRKHLGEIAPNVAPAAAPRVQLGRALLEYTAADRDPAALQRWHAELAAPGNAATTPPGAAATAGVLAAIAAGELQEALTALAELEDHAGHAALRHTLDFLQQPPAGAAAHPLLKSPRLAVPLGAGRDRWVVLAADRQLHIYDVASNELTPLDPPTPNWFPGPRNWPWLGRDEASGRVFVYGVRRVIELGSDATPDAQPLQLNIDTAAIESFDRLIAPVFAAVADAVRAAPREPAEDGEFLRSELRVNTDFTSDPDLPDLAVIRVPPQDDRLVHVAFRGGPHLLVDRRGPRVWSGRAIAEALSLPQPPAFFVEAGRRDGDAPPTALLLSDHGLIRFQGASGEFDRIALPGDAPHVALIPESTPYARRDRRWVYFARPPEDGGQVFRLALASNTIEPLELTNMALPAEYYTIRRRSELRRQIDDLFDASHIPPLEAFVADVIQIVTRPHETPQ